MNPRNILVSVVLLAVMLFGGFALGSLLQAPEPRNAEDKAAAPAPLSAPQLLQPADGSEFVDSGLELLWHWSSELGESQRYALRVWTDEQPYLEVWTVEERVSAKDILDSFSLAVGSFFWQVVIVNVDADGEYAGMGSEWSDVFEIRRVRRLSISAKPYDELSPIAKQIAGQNLSTTEIIDAAHRFIQSNSRTDFQESFAADYSDAIEIMYNHSLGLGTETPQLQCDGRSTAMLTILKELGIESRLVFLYSPAPGYLSEHTVLEVFNPERQAWQVHDLAWDFYFAESPSMERVSAERILFGSSENLLGCPIQGGPCDQEILQESIGYFDALRYGYTFEVWANPDRFDLSMRFAGQGGRNLAEFIAGDHLRSVTIKVDNWARP